MRRERSRPPDSHRDEARFSIAAPLICAGCGARRDKVECLALGNAFLADRLTLAFLCASCGAWSILHGDVYLRAPTPLEQNELAGDYRAQRLFAVWKGLRDAGEA